MKQKALVVYAVVVLISLIVSAIEPHDRLTWWLEVLPVLLVAPILIFTYKRFPLSSFLYLLITLHAVVLIVGGHYTYARVPLGFWVQDWFELGRNPYDKLGHFMQGFVPFFAAREILLRNKIVPLASAAGYLSICVAMTISAIYELIEWWGALLLGQGADQFLGTQGYLWDTQSDMWWALIGAGLALLFFSKVHDKSMEGCLK